MENLKTHLNVNKQQNVTLHTHVYTFLNVLFLFFSSSLSLSQQTGFILHSEGLLINHPESDLQNFFNNIYYSKHFNSETG